MAEVAIRGKVKGKLGFIYVANKNVFDGLEKYVNSPNIPVKTKKVSYLPKAKQLMLSNPDTYTTNHERGLRTHSGKFFEFLAQAIFGGLIKQKIEIRVKIRDSIYSEICEMDLTIPERKTFIEVKSTMQNDSLKFLDFQIAGNIALQTMDEFKDWNMFYLIFRHGIKKISSRFKGKPLENLVKEISENVRSMFMFPFSMVYYLHTKIPDTCSRHDNQTYSRLTRFNQTGLHNLLINPKETIKCLGLSPVNYVVRRKKFPKEIKIDGSEINNFPVLLIQDKDYRKWVNEQRKELREKLPKYKEAQEIIRRIEARKANKKDYGRLEELEGYEEPPTVIEHIINFGMGGGKKVIKEEDGAQEKIEFKVSKEPPDFSDILEGYEPKEGEREPGQEG